MCIKTHFFILYNYFFIQIILSEIKIMEIIMIKRYEIKKENNEEVLYIEINFNYEFSKIGLFNDIENLLKKLNFLVEKL